MPNMTLRFAAWLIIVLPLSLSGCNAKSSESETLFANNKAATNANVTRVTVVQPQRKTLNRKTEQPGRVEAFEETEVVSKISGFIERIYVEMGDLVKGPVYDSDGKMTEPGQLLAELTVPEMVEERLQKESLVLQAKAEVEQARAAVTVAEALVESAKSLEPEAQAAIKRTDALYERWQSELTRLTGLAAQAAVTSKVVDETRSQATAANAARDEAQAKFTSAKAGVKESDAKREKAKADQATAEAKVEVAKAELQRVEAMLEYRKIRAPFDGVVSGRHVHTGHLVQSAIGSQGKSLFTVTRIDKVRIFIDVPEKEARFADPKNGVEINIPALGNKTLSNDKIAHSAWALDAANRTLKVEIDVANDSGELRPGMYVTSTLTLESKKQVLVIPVAAVMTDIGKTSCYCIESGKVVRKELVLGLRVGTEAEVASGLSGDENLVAANPGTLTVGQTVEVAPSVAANK